MHVGASYSTVQNLFYQVRYLIFYVDFNLMYPPCECCIIVELFLE